MVFKVEACWVCVIEDQMYNFGQLHNNFAGVKYATKCGFTPSKGLQPVLPTYPYPPHSLQQIQFKVYT